jgi:hypothetical protein
MLESVDKSEGLVCNTIVIEVTDGIAVLLRHHTSRTRGWLRNVYERRTPNKNHTNQ